MNTLITQAQAREIFLKTMVAHVRQGVAQGVIRDLDQGPPGQEPDTNKLQWHTWYEGLEPTTQTMVQEIVHDIIDATLFSTFVVLDGAAGGYPVPGILSDFALYIQIYEDDVQYRMNQPKQGIRINPPNADDDLHDLFQDYVKP